MAEVKFYRCNHCGNIVAVINDAKVPMSCCGERMELLQAGSVDAAAEKHVPAVTRNGDSLVVRVGSVDHPMVDVHYIEWVAVATENALQLAYLKPGQEPTASFVVPADQSVTVYAYCNLHGLWKAEA